MKCAACGFFCYGDMITENGTRLRVYRHDLCGWIERFVVHG